MSEDRKVTWLVDGSGFQTRVEPFPRGCKMNLTGCEMIPKFCFGAILSFSKYVSVTISRSEYLNYYSVDCHEM